MKNRPAAAAEAGDALYELRQMTIVSIRVLDGLGEPFRQAYEEAHEALSFCLHDILARTSKLEDDLLRAEPKEMAQ
ncbi:hypothetical protein AB4Z51_42520 [Bradyrhizobium sp. 2TAF36]|jgi:hypothetical protein|uniref:Uncharacterized protein n=1 Tax=Bradyrhizobium barranii subsp. barranii TaxID=2823807 RepID=A0A939MG90_9BRAD|nr:hypothetical protein [Bradyrhizobium barranii]UEM10435.1 hypothetical protein J4G43_038155 [Bradyrhizobium barranii subsp. barranii]